jgi:hypothetical protein
VTDETRILSFPMSGKTGQTQAKPLYPGDASRVSRNQGKPQL